MNTRVIALTAIGIILLLLVPSFIAYWIPLTTMATVCFVGATYFGIRDLNSRRIKDPYSLAALRKLDEKKEIDEILDEHDRMSGDMNICTNCGDLYSNRLLACPRCGRACM